MLDIFFTDFVVFENKNQHLCFSVQWVLKTTFNSFFKKSVWTIIVSLTQEFFIDLFSQKREVNTLVGDVIKHMTPDRAFEQHYLEVYCGEVCLLLIYWVEFHVLAVTARN